MKSFLGFGRGSRPDEPPRPAPPTSSGPASASSFLTGDERVDATNVALLLRTIAEVSSTIDVERLLVSIVDKAIAVTRAERGFLLLRDPNGKELSIRLARDARGAPLAGDLRYSKSVVAQVETSGEPVRSMVNSDAEALELGRSVFDLKIRAVMCVPLRASGDRVLGAVYVDSRVASREFSPADLAFFAAFGSQATIALENARLVQDSLEKERMAQELRIAHDIQRRMLPATSPDLPGFTLAGACEALTEAAGDSFDFVSLPDGSVAIVVGDVSGHGIGPALVTVSARARLRSYLGLGHDLGDAVTRLNRDLRSEMEEGMFQTLFVAVIDARAGTLRYVNAGHPPPMLRRAAGGAFTALARTGVALGFLDEPYAPSGTVELARGDVLVAFSDGLVEARRSDGELFGEQRLRDAIGRAAASSADAIVRTLIDETKRFGGGRAEDDLTVVALRREPA
ncbi:MAG TPA: GAF domain-containing SpoIIE family protein phosphatase [Planctomycetota bacterium]|nr:GAF domain-containing SpoIIE family protein phosphatase [Planctomycetota bacterium]